jgi:WhiB family redox-sensing transcriptional regulator
MRADLRSLMELGPGEVGDLVPAGPPWTKDGLCREHPELDFVPPDVVSELNRRRLAAAVEVCQRCLVKAECLAYALEDRSLIGVWGGTTAAERRSGQLPAETVPRAS